MTNTATAAGAPTPVSRGSRACVVLAIAATAALAACSSAPEITQPEEIRSAELTRFSAFTLVVEGTETVKRQEEYQALALAWMFHRS
jgi:uncharacterized lipoprotein